MLKYVSLRGYMHCRVSQQHLNETQYQSCFLQSLFQSVSSKATDLVDLFALFLCLPISSSFLHLPLNTVQSREAEVQTVFTATKSAAWWWGGHNTLKENGVETCVCISQNHNKLRFQQFCLLVKEAGTHGKDPPNGIILIFFSSGRRRLTFIQNKLHWLQRTGFPYTKKLD